MRIGVHEISCLYDTSIVNASGVVVTAVSDAKESTGYLAVKLVNDGTTDNNTNLPVPRVALASAAADHIYGALISVNTATGRCAVQTRGIVPFLASGLDAASVSGDLGVIADGTNAGTVTKAAAANQGRGSIVSRSGAVKAYVDLDIGQKPTA